MIDGAVEIYTKPNCGYCVKAKQLLALAKIPYVEHRLDVDFTREMLLEKYPEAKTYPVVVIDGFFIGGSTDLAIILEAQQGPLGGLLTE
jgi:glutaredoxin 3